jgi:hypothetical protein
VAEELLAKGVITEASEAALEQAIRAGAKGLADKVSIEAMASGCPLYVSPPGKTRSSKALGSAGCSTNAEHRRTLNFDERGC